MCHGWELGLVVERTLAAPTQSTAFFTTDYGGGNWGCGRGMVARLEVVTAIREILKIRNPWFKKVGVRVNAAVVRAVDFPFPKPWQVGAKIDSADGG